MALLKFEAADCPAEVLSELDESELEMTAAVTEEEVGWIEEEVTSLKALELSELELLDILLGLSVSAGEILADIAEEIELFAAETLELKAVLLRVAVLISALRLETFDATLELIVAALALTELDIELRVSELFELVPEDVELDDTVALAELKEAEADDLTELTALAIELLLILAAEIALETLLTLAEEIALVLLARAELEALSTLFGSAETGGYLTLSPLNQFFTDPKIDQPSSSSEAEIVGLNCLI